MKVSQAKINSEENVNKSNEILEYTQKIQETWKKFNESKDEQEKTLLNVKLQEYGLNINKLTKDININANKNKELIDEVNSILDVPSLDSSNNPTNNFQKQDEIITPSLQLEESKDIKKSNIFNFDNFDEWFNNLDVVKQLSFSLLLTHGVVISALTNIIFVYYGNILIDKFNLETRYPKLKKIIEYRNKFSQFYFLNSCFIIFIVSVTYISFAIVQLSS